jgi:iron complex outermembrane receptor protein
LNVDPWVTFFDAKNNRHYVKTRFYRVTNAFYDNPNNDNASDLYFGEYQFQKLFRNQLNWTIGFSGQYGIANAALYGDHDNSTLALFTQLDYKFFNRLSATLGLRWERYGLDDLDKESATVLRAGLNYQAGKASFIRASFGQGYRFPSIAEKFTATSLGGLNVFPNPELESERGWSTELGFRQGFRISNWTAFIDAAVFWSEYNNMIEFTFGIYPPDTADVPTIEDVGFKSLNIGKARINGFEIEITGDGRFGNVPFKTFMGYTYINPLDLSSDTLTNNTLKYRYRHTFKGDIEFNFSRFSTGLSFIYRSFMERIDEAFEQEILGVEFFPGLKEYREENNRGSIVFDLRGSWQVARSTRISLIMKNIFNQEYMGRPGDIRPPRNITLQVLVKI